jgi:hypothetical protein
MLGISLARTLRAPRVSGPLPGMPSPFRFHDALLVEFSWPPRLPSRRGMAMCNLRGHEMPRSSAEGMIPGIFFLPTPEEQVDARRSASKTASYDGKAVDRIGDRVIRAR